MNYASVCDGIGAAHVAWQPLGWECRWTSEIEAFPATVVEQRFGFVNVGDMTKITEEMLDEHVPIDLLVGGTPCQSFSVAGLRGGLADPRGNLALRFVQLAAVMQPKWIVWENVPGVLSSGKGRDFGTFLGALGELGYGFAYRVLDAQWFGVAQRRRRVFVVGHLGDWRRAAAVLFERESVFGNPPTRGKAWEGTSAATPISTRTGRSDDRGDGGDNIVLAAPQVANPLTARMAKGINTTCDEGQTPIVCGVPDPAYAISAGQQGKGGVFGSGRDSQDTFAVVAFHPTQDPISSVDGLTHCLGSGSSRGCATAAVAFKPSHFTRGKDGKPSPVTPPLSADADKGDQDTVLAVPFTKSKRAQSTTDDETWVPGEVSPTMSCFDQGDTRATTVVAFDILGTPATNAAKTTDVHVPLRARTPRQSEASTTTVVAQGFTYSGYSNQPAWMTGDRTDCLPASGHSDGSHQGVGVATAMAVRRLTPRECERLQGFPDDYTLVEYRKKPAADGPRYRALGNSMAVPVMRWIGERIAMVESKVTQ
jgi:DNA (cytosine-5)-methyltransferase 1